MFKNSLIGRINEQSGCWHWHETEKRFICETGSEDFIRWINSVCDIKHNGTAKVVEIDTNFDPALPIAMF